MMTYILLRTNDIISDIEIYLILIISVVKGYFGLWQIVWRKLWKRELIKPVMEKNSGKDIQVFCTLNHENRKQKRERLKIF